MINLKTKKQKLAAHKKVNRMIAALVIPQTKHINKILNLQYRNVANQISNGNQSVSIGQTVQLKKAIQVLYKRTAITFNQEVFKLFQKQYEIIEQKSLLSQFWKKMRQWIDEETAEKVKEIQNTTKSKLKTIIKKGLNQGLSSMEIARKIRDETGFNLSRARLIARTEVHNASVASVDLSMDTIAEQNIIEFIREWINAGDARVRGSSKRDKYNHILVNGQKRKRNEAFDVSGEQMLRPGDGSKGASIGNIVRCRCVLIYHTIKGKKNIILSKINQFKSVLANQDLVEE